MYMLIAHLFDGLATPDEGVYGKKLHEWPTYNFEGPIQIPRLGPLQMIQHLVGCKDQMPCVAFLHVLLEKPRTEFFITIEKQIIFLRILWSQVLANPVGRSLLVSSIQLYGLREPVVGLDGILDDGSCSKYRMGRINDCWFKRHQGVIYKKCSI